LRQNEVSYLEIYYWKNGEWMTWAMLGTYPTRMQFQKDYVKTPVSFDYMEHRDIDANLEEVFVKMNLSDNPMLLKENQQWIKENLKPDAHTSLSTGDIVHHRGEYYICADVGFKRLSWLGENGEKVRWV